MPYGRPPIFDTDEWPLIGAGGPTGVGQVDVDLALTAGCTAYAFAAYVEGNASPDLSGVAMSITLRDVADLPIWSDRLADSIQSGMYHLVFGAPAERYVVAHKSPDADPSIPVALDEWENVDHLKLSLIGLGGADVLDFQWEAFRWQPHAGSGGGGVGPVEPCDPVIRPPWPYGAPPFHTAWGPVGTRHGRRTQIGTQAVPASLRQRPHDLNA